MKILGDVCFNPSLRSFGYSRSIILDFCGKSHCCKVLVGLSFGCNSSTCNYGGFCKDCPNVFTDLYTL